MCQSATGHRYHNQPTTALFSVPSSPRKKCFNVSTSETAVSKNAQLARLFAPYGDDLCPSGIWYRQPYSNRTRIGELTEPEEAERAYQDHFLLILGENLATPTMMGNDTEDYERISVTFPPLQGVEKKLSRDPRSGTILDLQHH